MDLIILRHGEAGKRVMLTDKDAERTLTVSGKDEVKEVAECMGKLNLKFDAIMTSPLKRASETAEIVAKTLKHRKTVEQWDELKPEGDSKALYRRLSKFRPDSSVLVVGHEPYLSSMIVELIGGKGDARIVLKKAGLAKVELSSVLPVPSGNLRWLLTPRLLKKVT
ncbi:MAG: phosphohistidine phosphatase SixA [Thaumarchaeota archaeon]|nr:phosphohistidine phosphatase SixA [Nitrososphaerota archaeon]